MLVAQRERADPRNDVRMLLAWRMRAARAEDVLVGDFAAQVAGSAVPEFQVASAEPAVLDVEQLAVLSPCKGERCIAAERSRRHVRAMP